mmetsp:Transcript_137111/g.250047  ORF Transcript_137111/g.250047 Transcript_137111/m.250047 type:complete len:708 (+) Transcript_137111:184-2307(+)
MKAAASPKSACQDLLKDLASITQSLQDKYEEEISQLRREIEQLKQQKSGAPAAKPKPKWGKKGAEASLAAVATLQHAKDFSEVPEKAHPAGNPKDADKSQQLVTVGRKVAGTFEVRQVWNIISEGGAPIFLLGEGMLKQESEKRQQKRNTLKMGRQDMNAGATDSLMMKYNGLLGPYLMQPTCSKRLIWDVAGTFWVGYDMLTIPLTVFRTPDGSFLTTIDWFVQLFWTADVGMSLTTGYFEEGNVVMEPRKIMLHYARTWMVPDIIVVGTDWICTFVDAFTTDSGASATENIIALIRILRIFRIIRLLRLAKLKQMINNLYDRINSESVSIWVNIIKLVVLLLVINHFIACFWFLISKWADGDSWLRVHKFDDVSWEYQYLTSLHWSLTQFTPSSMHVQPQNVGERAFAIVIIIFALLMFSQVVGSITSSMTQLRQLSEQQWKQFWLLRRYLRQSNVPLELSHRVQRYLEYACEHEKKQVSVNSIKIMGLLSEQLRENLECAVNMPYVKQHPLFEHLDFYAKLSMTRLAATGMTRTMYADGDTLFFENDSAKYMMFISAGELEYTRKSGPGGVTATETLVQGCIAEAIVWTEWTHVGELNAKSECEVIKLDPTMFASVMRTSPALYSQMSFYAEVFLAWLNSTTPEDLSDIVMHDDSETNVDKLVDRFGGERRDSRKSLINSLKSRFSTKRTGGKTGPTLLGKATE